MENDWIYLYKITMIPNASGVTQIDTYASAKSKDEARIKASKYMSGNYDISKIIKVGELYDFGTDFYTPEKF